MVRPARAVSGTFTRVRVGQAADSARARYQSTTLVARISVSRHDESRAALFTRAPHPVSRTSQASELPIKQFTIDSHYVPQHYLGAWSDDGVRVNAYRLVVPNERVVVWKPRAIRGLVKHQHLYTSMLTGEASDEFERWIEREVETPGAEAIDKVRANRRLSPSDWRKLSYYLAALDRRTPAAFLDHLKFYDDNMPSVIENVMAGLRARIAAGQKFQIPREGEPPQPLRHGDFPLFVSTVRDRESGQLNLHVEVLSGREMWLYDLRRAITQLAR